MDFNLEAGGSAFYGKTVPNLLEEIRKLGRKLMTLRDTPHAIAGGVAIGVFMGFTPLFGLKTLLSLGAAYLLRCNRVAAVIAVSLHDIVTPIWPFLLRLEYDLGYWLLNHPHHFPPKLEAHHIHLMEMLHWTTFLHLGLPLLVGSLFLAAPVSVLFYIVFLSIFRAHSRRTPPPAA